ncbi:LysE family translocator [Polycladidibacter hongkongensis]|uniref:LysE family translocator n=1 Tax=Polycladidibacter hongkongensis TaxID=1647556 RepID=UPI00082E7164|nr:LysE family transporter [Pseudovibrio hongkongensis]
MDAFYYLTGIAIGLATSAPVGPVNIMAIKRALQRGFLAGLSAGLGAVVADSFFALAAALGVTAISQFIDEHRDLIQFMGGTLLCIYGLHTLRAKPKLQSSEGSSAPDVKGFATSFFMTLTNPGAVLGFIAIFGSLGAGAPKHSNYVGALILVAGVITGALLWWAFISAAVATFLRNRASQNWLIWVNRVAGVLLVGFGVLLLARTALTILTQI